MPLTHGEQLGHYTVQSLIGKGGMGEVYRARDTHLGRDVAIKVLPLSVSQDPERRARFEREAKVLAALNHPNIATIYGVEHNALVMELVDGETLPRGLDLEIALRYAKQIAEALEAAHENHATEALPLGAFRTHERHWQVLEKPRLKGKSAQLPPKKGD